MALISVPKPLPHHSVWESGVPDQDTYAHSLSLPCLVEVPITWWLSILRISVPWGQWYGSVLDHEVSANVWHWKDIDLPQFNSWTDKLREKNYIVGIVHKKNIPDIKTEDTGSVLLQPQHTWGPPHMRVRPIMTRYQPKKDRSKTHYSVQGPEIELEEPKNE